MNKVGNWYKLLGMLAIAFQAEQDAEKHIKPKKVGDKDYWPKYAAMPKGMTIFEFEKKFKMESGEQKRLSFCIPAANKKNAQKKYDKLILELKEWDGSQEELGHIIRSYNKYCAPIKAML